MSSKQEVLKLIELYRDNECLWNINSKLFRRTDIKNNTYRKIATEMGLDEDYKKKIKSLRTSYTAEKKRIENSKISGAGLEEIKESTLFYFDEMTFLDPCIIYRKGDTNFSESTNSSDAEHLDSQTSESDATDYEFDVPLPKKQREAAPVLPLSNFDEALDKFISAVSSEKEEDEFHLFGLQIASNLRKLPLVHAVQFMASIQQQMADLRVTIINTPEPTTISHQFPSCSPLITSSIQKTIQPLKPSVQQHNIQSGSAPATSPLLTGSLNKLKHPFTFKIIKPFKIIRPPSSCSSSSSSRENDWHDQSKQSHLNANQIMARSTPIGSSPTSNLVNIAMHEADIDEYSKF